MITLKAIILTFFAVNLLAATSADNSSAPMWGHGEVMYEWVFVDFDWPSDAVRIQKQQDGSYDPTHNFISGIKIYRGQVYVTVPRLRYTNGVPSTLNQVVMKEGKPVLRPFPNWEAQELGNCSALQCAMSMEIDPVSGLMYVIDTGRSGFFGDVSNQPPPTLCTPKLVVYDLSDGHLVRSHDFPADLVSKETNFLNDIVLDRGSPQFTLVRWVYITDAVDNKLVIFNLESNQTHTIHHSSMDFDPGAGSDIVVNGKMYKMKTPIDGLAISSDFEYVYYCALGSRDLYQVPASALRYKDEDFAGNVRFVGAKISQTGGMTYTSDKLYYGALTKNAVYRWEVDIDKQSQGVNEARVVMKTETQIVQDNVKLEWPDSFTVDEHGYLWFTACRAEVFLLGNIDFSGNQGANFRIWRVNISESSYLAPPGASLLKQNE